MGTFPRAISNDGGKFIGMPAHKAAGPLAFRVQDFLTRHALGTLWGQIFVPASNLLCALLLVRILHASDANLFFLLLSMALVASVFSDFGQRSTIYTDVAGLRGASLGSYIFRIYRLRTVLGIIVFGIMVGLSPWLNIHAPGTAVLLGAMAANMYVADPGIKILCGKSLGHLEIPLSAIDRGTVVSGLLVMYVFAVKSLSLALGIYLVAGLLRFVTAAFLVRSHVIEREPDRLADSFRGDSNSQAVHSIPELRFGWNHFWSGLVLLVTMLNFRLPILILPAVHLEMYAAHLGILLAVCQSFLLVPSIIARVLFPKIVSREANETNHGMLLTRRVLFGSLALCVVSGLLVTLVLRFSAVPLLSFLHPKYAHRPELLRLASLGIPLLCCGQIVRLLAMSGGVARSLFAPVAVGTLAGLFSMVGLSQYLGPEGVVYGYLISESITLTLTLTVVLRRIDSSVNK